MLDPTNKKTGPGGSIAAETIGYDSIGIEIDPKFYQIAVEAIPKLSKILVNLENHSLAERSPDEDASSA